MSELTVAIAELKEDEVNRLVREKIESGVDPLMLVDECREGMRLVGERHRTGDYFLGELIMSGEIFKNAMGFIGPRLKADRPVRPLARMVVGTAKGDIHNIGKDIAAMLLSAAGFEVYDAGIDVTPEAFVQKVRETGSTILGISGLLTTSFESMKLTVQALETAGLRGGVKVIVGGGIVNEMVQKYVGADAFTDDAPEGIEICKRFALG
jgi:methylmalonyl-CoA mutase cobalamin-binding domain/chain